MTNPAVSPTPGSTATLPPGFPTTLAAALQALAGDSTRGFVFAQPDGSERFCPFSELHAEAVRRGAHLVAHGLRKGDRVALVIPEGDEFVLSFPPSVL